MTACEYMNQLRSIKVLIKTKAERIAELREMAVNIGVPYFDDVKIQKSRPVSKMEEIICKYTDLENELREEIIDLTEKQFEIIHTIEKLPPVYYEFLYKLYIQEMDLCDLADNFQHSYSWATTTHLVALKKVQKILDSSQN